jgi:hypothetical protein
VQRVIASGYDGFFEVELMGEDVEAADYHDVLDRSMRTFHEWVGAQSKVQNPKSNVASP